MEISERGKNLSNFVPPVWKLHNPYCHIRHGSYMFDTMRIQTSKIQRVSFFFLKRQELTETFVFSIETIYQSLLTYLKKLYENLPGKNKTKQTLESNYFLLKLEIEASWKTKTNIKKQTTSTLVYLELSMSWKNKTKSVSCSKIRKKKRSKKKGKKYEVQLTRKL